MIIYKISSKAASLSQDALKFTEEGYNFLLQNGFKSGFHRIVENNKVKKDIFLTPRNRTTTKNKGNWFKNNPNAIKLLKQRIYSSLQKIQNQHSIPPK